GIQPGDQLVVAGARPEPLDKLDGGGRGGPGGAGGDGPGGGEVVGGAGVAGAFRCELVGPARPLVRAGAFVGGRQGEGDLLGGARVQQRPRDRGVHRSRRDGPAGWRGQPVTAGAA